MAREKAAAAQAGANEAALETPGSGSESESDPDPTPGGTVGGTGEEASLGVSGSSGAEWSGVEDLSNGQELKQDNVVSNNLLRDRV